ncbi:hypothetical protein F5148DRAFT_992132 [Russula earlei]|uniref:Uncharacterized protein n=1 Tax=Russula earlei TaxID=71964 RepID=A0ACC0ULP8_9AGAM|nr:hypothetical protein F5148DRAFT_992132 [Russula earlei]
MILDPSASEHLKPWLTKNLEPICDADPSALADYILALLKHSGPESELRKELAAQLDEFLEKEGPPFIDALFTTLRTKSYLPYNSPPPPSAPLLPADNGIPIPLDAIIPSGSSSPSERSRKRQSDYDDDIRPPKGPRLTKDASFSRPGPHRGPGWSNNNWSGASPGRGGYSGGLDDVNGATGPRMNGRGPPSQYHPPEQRRGICRDYYNNGYCARGAYCKYSHGDDALVPGVFPIPQQIPGNIFMPIFPPGMPFGMGPPAAYDPHEARLDMRVGAPSGPMGRTQRAAMLPRVNGDAQSLHPQASGELPVIQDLTPAVYNDESAQQQPERSVHPPSLDAQPNGINIPASPTTKMEVDAIAGSPSSYPVRPHRGSPNSPARARGGRPGIFGGEVQRFHPERKDKTLVVEKIPEDKLSLDAVNGWFKRFGTVTNVAVDAPSAKALVSFSTHEEAHAAWKTEDAVFSNRFVKVYWHRPMDGQGLAGQRALAASAPVVASVAAREQTQTTPSSDAVPADTSVPGPAAKKIGLASSSSTASALAARQKLLEQQIAEQKALMEKLNTASAEEKKEIFAQLRKLGREIKATSSPAAPSPSTKPSLSIPKPEDREAKERERLDKELELHSAAVDGEETTEALQAKLAKLKAEAASLGIDPSAESLPTYSYRGRGRGRGRAFYRGGGRGGPPRASMKLDNRPKKLLIKDVGSDGVQAVRDWYEPGGQVDAIETLENGDVVVSFRTRAAAEQGLAKGFNIPLAGQKQVSWYVVSPAATGATPSKSTTLPGAPTSEYVEEEYSREHYPVAHLVHEEEPAVSGWGGDEDEDGMGML